MKRVMVTIGFGDKLCFVFWDGEPFSSDFRHAWRHLIIPAYGENPYIKKKKIAICHMELTKIGFLISPSEKQWWDKGKLLFFIE